MLSLRVGGLPRGWLSSAVCIVDHPLSSLPLHSDVCGGSAAGFSFAPLCALVISPQFVSAAVVWPLVQPVDESSVAQDFFVASLCLLLAELLQTSPPAWVFGLSCCHCVLSQGIQSGG